MIKDDYYLSSTSEDNPSNQNHSSGDIESKCANNSK